MAFNPAPSAWFDSWSEDGTNITVPLASFPQTNAAEADGTTGDIRKVVFAILEKLYNEFIERAALDRPTKMLVARTKAWSDSTSIMSTVYTVSFTNEVMTEDVKAE